MQNAAVRRPPLSTDSDTRMKRPGPARREAQVVTAATLAARPLVGRRRRFARAALLSNNKIHYHLDLYASCRGRRNPSAVPQDHAIATLYREHHSWLQTFLRRRLGNGADAADLAQDTFERILAAPDHIAQKQAAWQLDEPRAYLTVIARRLVSNLFRRRSLEQAYLDALALMPQPQAPSEEQRYIILESLQQIDAMLAGLPARTRAAFLMAQLEGLAYAEIATRLTVSERTIKRYVAEGLARCIYLMA